ncbi:MAG: metal-binding protein [Candidatus Bathyarchaeota archaeon]|nr:metal-binding protein [Candidatus Bathyarchaeota archaeon]
MADGKTHHAISLIMALSTAASVKVLGQPASIMLPIASGMLAGILITPDLDVQNPVHANNVAYRVHWIIGAAWRFIWWPYARLIPHHRHWLSHLPFVGTLVRLIYLYVLGYLGMSVTHLISQSVSVSQLPQLWRPYAWPEWLIFFVWGLMISDFGHWCLDGFPTNLPGNTTKKRNATTE